MPSGIIAEFNIFHNGHKYLTDEAKKISDGVIAVMSGSFVQRGDAAFTDKWARAKAALMCGVDLVIELPVCCALNAAPNFAAGAVSILDALGICDTLIFGSESGSLGELARAARILDSESDTVSELLKGLMAEGMSYPAALAKAHKGDIDGDLLHLPNNILAVEYLRALTRINSGITPIAVRRHKTAHDDRSVTGNFASASKIREIIAEGGDARRFLPYRLDDAGGAYPYLISRLDSAFIAHFRSVSADSLKNVSEISEGLENRIIRAAKQTDSFASLVGAVKSKRYTMSRIRRVLIASLIGFTKDIYSPKPDYIRVLGMNMKGAELLKSAKKNCGVPIITKTADYKGISRKLELDIRANDIAALCAPEGAERRGGTDYTRPPVILNI